MYIKHLHIDAFGTLRDREIELSPGLNIIEGANESGKSATAMFIKFMLYGLSGKSTGGEMTERRRYVNWDTGTAAGSMTVVTDTHEYRIERTLAVSRTEDGAKGRESARESVRIIDTATNTPVHRGEVPGEVLCGVPENIFMNTVFVRQIDGARVNSSGMLTSIENLLFTANETVSTKKALERLDDARRQILHKNGTGGLLGELKAKRSEAAAALREAQSQSGTLTGSETELAEAKAHCEALAEKVRQQEAICRYGAVNLTKRRFDTASAAKEKIAQMREQLSAFEKSGINRTYIAQLQESENRISRAAESVEKLRIARDEAAARWKAAGDVANAIDTETEDAMTAASSLQLRARNLTAAGVALFFFAVITGVAAWFFYEFAIPLYLAPVILAAVLAAIGVLCLVLRGQAARRLREQLDGIGAASISAIPAAIAAQHGGYRDTDTLRGEKQALQTSCTEAETLRRAESEAAFTLAAKILPDTDTTRAAAEDDAELMTAARTLLEKAKAEATAQCDEADAIRREADAFSGRLSVLLEQLAGEDEAAIRTAFQKNMQTVEGRIASGIDAPRLEAARRQLETLQVSYEEALSQMHQLETGVAAARAVTVSPIEITRRISEMDTEIEELSRRHDAYCLAMDTLKDAADSMRASVLPKVVTEACASVNRLSGGAFDAVGVDQELSMTFTRNGQTRDVEFLSEGTKDVAYISLRRALTGVLFAGTRPPLIYDESFARVDETRLSRVLSLLSSQEAGNAQSILLTCRKLEADIADRMGGAHTVRL